MPALIPCPSCDAHLLPGGVRCPSCDAALPGAPRLLRTAAGIALLGLTLTACTKTTALYGVMDTGAIDNDGDGWATIDGDCDDEDASINPDAEEIAGDGVDSNCDGDDDT